MEQLTWIFLGCIALSISAATLFTDLEDILGGLVATLAWALWALGATNIEYVNQAGEVVGSQNQTGLAFFGAGMAALMLLVMLVGAGRMLDVRDAGFDPQQ